VAKTLHIVPLTCQADAINERERESPGIIDLGEAMTDSGELVRK